MKDRAKPSRAMTYRPDQPSFSVRFSAGALLLALGGCGVASVRHTKTIPGGEGSLPVLKCEASDGKVRCTEPGPSIYVGETETVRLGVSGRDLLGATAFGWNVCAISKKYGFRCFDMVDRTTVQASTSRRMESRTAVAWKKGLCVETQRDDHNSGFECLIENGGTQQRVEFWTSSEHRVAAFSSGVCICSDTRMNLDVERLATGAACIVARDDVPLERYSHRLADETSRTLQIRGPWKYGDFSFICEDVSRSSDQEAMLLIEGWEDGSIPLPAPRSGAEGVAEGVAARGLE